MRKDLTGSVGSIKNEQVTQVQSQTVDQALVGQLSGVFVESNAGAPGAGASVNIRGLSQIIGDNQPLYVVDGVPILVNPNFGTFAGAGNRENPLLAIDPNNIERVDVLKDASSAAIYGSRAANGGLL
nr:TonB-dependent receptor plug domain-containing protein [Algibacter lectus]